MGFTIGLLQNIDLSNRDCQALILAPTRELASQIVKVVMAIGDYLGVSTMACIGGTNVRQDMDKLRAGVQLVVGTPGRVFDMINRRALAVDYIHYFVKPVTRQVCDNREGKKLRPVCDKIQKSVCSYKPVEKCEEEAKEYCFKVEKKVWKKVCTPEKKLVVDDTFSYV